MYEHEATVIEGVDFAIIIGERPPSGYPGDILDTSEANAALKAAYTWAAERASDNAYANSAKVYIEAIPLNRAAGMDDRDTADKTQLLYVISNLMYWRGDIARASKIILNAYIENLKSRY